MKSFKIKTIIMALSIVGIMQAQDATQQGSTNNIDKLLPNGLQQLGGRFGSRALLSTINELAFIKQLGNNNTTYITQSSGKGITPNLASIIQGNNNNASITQKGNGNINSITQIGNNNGASINIDGDNNISNIIQIGNRNYSLQYIKASNKNYNIIQMGNNNSFQRYDNGQSPKAYIISQKGNGLKLIISNNNYKK